MQIDLDRLRTRRAVFRPGGTSPSSAGAVRMAAKRYQPLGWFRLLLSGMVMATHFSQNLGSAAIRDAIFPLCIAMIGVSCFFTLSGFIIAEAMQAFYAERPVSFFVNRILRIMPPLVGALIVASAIYSMLLAYGALRLFHGMQHSDHIVLGLPNILRNLASLLPLPRGMLPPDVEAIPVLWTLRLELMFYGAMFGAAVLASLLARLRLCPYQTAMRGLLIAMAALCLVGTASRMAGKAPDLVSYFSWFALGVALFYVQTGSRAACCLAAIFLLASGWQFAAVQIASRAAYQLNPLLAGRPVSPVLPLALLAACLALMGLMISLRISRFRKVDHALGSLTYPLYLNHVTAGVIVLSLAEPGPGAIAAATILAIVLSLIMDFALEPVSVRWRTRLRGAPLT